MEEIKHSLWCLVKSIFLLDLNHMDSRSGIIIVMVRGPHDLKYNVLTYSYLSKLWRIVTTADYTNWACWLILAFSKLTALIWILEHCRGDSPKLGLLNGKILWLDLNTSQPYFAMLLLKWFVILRTIQHKKKLQKLDGLFRERKKYCPIKCNINW